MASWSERRRRERRQQVEWWVAMLAVIGGMFMLGLLVGSKALASPPPVWPNDPCAKRYPAVETFVHHGRLLPKYPVLLPYAQCVRGTR